ncbi:MAG: ATP synthase subunit I [Nitrospirota bacterium]
MLLQDEALLTRIERFIWLLFFLLSAASFVLLSFKFAAGVLLGSALAIANFYLMKRHLRGALDPQRQRRARFLYLLKYYIRFLATAAIIAGGLIKGWVEPFGLLLGLSVNVIGIVLVGLNEARKLNAKGVV